MNKALKFIAAGFLTFAQAALPPLAAEDLQRDADGILTGKIVDITVEEGSEVNEYIATIEVSSRDKPEEQIFEEGSRPIEEIHYFRRTVLPEGYTGPTGQDFLPEQGQRAKFFFETGNDGINYALKPNGIEAVADELETGDAGDDVDDVDGVDDDELVTTACKTRKERVISAEDGCNKCISFCGLDGTWTKYECTTVDCSQANPRVLKENRGNSVVIHNQVEAVDTREPAVVQVPVPVAVPVAVGVPVRVHPISNTLQPDYGYAKKSQRIRGQSSYEK